MSVCAARVLCSPPCLFMATAARRSRYGRQFACYSFFFFFFSQFFTLFFFHFVAVACCLLLTMLTVCEHIYYIDMHT